MADRPSPNRSSSGRNQSRNRQRNRQRNQGRGGRPSGGGSRRPQATTAPPPVPPPAPGPGPERAALSRNRRRAVAAVAAPAVAVAVVVMVVVALAGSLAVAVPLAVVLAVAPALWVWRAGPGLVLRRLGARPADEDLHPRAFTVAEGLCATMGLEVPALWVTDDDRLDALAVGRHPRRSAIVLTSGLATSFDPVALEAVLAHELTHVKRGDVLPATVLAVLALPLAGLDGVGDLVHRLVGRGREFATDQSAVALTRYPPGLRDALADMAGSVTAGPANRIERVTRWLWMAPLGAEEPGALVGELDAASVRVAALDER